MRFWSFQDSQLKPMLEVLFNGRSLDLTTLAPKRREGWPSLECQSLGESWVNETWAVDRQKNTSGHLVQTSSILTL